MTEAQVAFLFNAAAALNKSTNEGNTILRSYYLMRCKDITKGYGLPNKYFSPQLRCPNCCIEWNKNTQVKVKSFKLSARQRKRLKSKKVKDSRKETVNLLNSNELEQICSFCSKKMSTLILKPIKELPKTTATLCNINSKENPVTNKQNSYENKTGDNIKKKSEILNPMKQLPKATAILHKMNSKENPVKNKQNNYKNKKVDDVRKKSANLYANALDIFSMKNKNNVLPNVIKEKPKVINNNKKKKDKFAGLCQKAVMASAKMREQNKKQNSLNLFLKPSQ